MKDGNRSINLLAGLWVCCWLCILVLVGPAAADPIFYEVLGFEDDVDVVVSPGHGFLIIPEELEGGPGQVTILALEPFSGMPLGEVFSAPVPGFERGVDPVILPTIPFPEGGYTAVIPVESADGMESAVMVLRLDEGGNVSDSRTIPLAELGFRPDVDPVWTHYMGPGIAFVALESPDGAVRGVLAIDVDPHDEGDDGLNAWGTCTLISSDGRLACGSWDAEVDWLPGLADGVDPVAYEFDEGARLALPVTSGEEHDLLLVDFDPTFEPPMFVNHTSVKILNEGGTTPLTFPGFEQDVHIRVFEGECGVAAPHEMLLVPVEGPGDQGDLYCLSDDGWALWTLSEIASTLGLSVPGYEVGVDLVPLCGLAADPANRLVVPLENEAGTDADLWILDLIHGTIIARAEDPALNPDLTIPGFEIGVDVVRWTQDLLLVPVESGDETGLVVLTNDAFLVETLFGSPILGFERSVDPVVAPVSDPDRKLYVPVESADGSDADVLIFDTPGDLAGWESLEELNAGLTLSGFEWDVDGGLVDHWLPGQAWLYLPEEDADIPGGRLRCQPVTAGARMFVFATPEVEDSPATLYTVHGWTGEVLMELSDVWGLETGLDLCNGKGSVTKGNPPWNEIPPGSDADTDPTWVTGVAGSGALEPPADPIQTWRLVHSNPLVAPGSVRFRVPRAGVMRLEIVDAAGRLARRLFDGVMTAGEHDLTWDGRDDRGLPLASGTYFLQLRGAHGLAVSKLIVLR